MVMALEERRLRPVLHALERRDYAPALKELIAYLKKSPKSTLANALKCLALEGVGESDEALKTYAFLLASQSADPLALIPAHAPPLLTNGKNPEHPDAALENDNDDQPDEVAPAAAAAEPAAIVKVKQPAKKPKGKGKSKSKPKSAGSGADKAAHAHAALLSAAAKDEIYSETVLNVLTRFLRSHDKLDDIATLYANAWTIHPDEIGFGLQCFLYGGVRRGDWLQTRKSALALHQVTGDPKTLFWAAFGAYQEAIELDLDAPSGPTHRAALLNMALTLLWTYPAEPYQSLETFLLAIRVLRAAGKHAEALRRMTPGLKAEPDSEDDARFEQWKEFFLARRRAETKGEQTPEEAERYWIETRGNRRSAERDLVRQWSSDLRLQWERWETVEEIARLSTTDGAASANDLEWDWSQEFVRCEDVIIGAEDVPNTNYKAYLSFITCLFVLLRKQASQDSTAAADNRETPQDVAKSSLLDLAERFGAKERAPILALLEINLRLNRAAHPHLLLSNANLETDSFALVQRYWKLFGDKGCLFDDLKPFWSLLDKQSLKDDLLARTAASEPRTVSEVVTLTNALKVAAYVLSEQSGPWNTAEQLAKLYRFARDALGKYPETDLHPADDLRLLEVHAIIADRCASGQASGRNTFDNLAYACDRLTDLLNDSPSNGPARILLIRLYRLLGCVSLLPAQIDLLKMRTFQHETVLHMVTERVSTFCATMDEKTGRFMIDLLQQGQGVPISTCAELSEGIVGALSEQSYSQIHSMIDMLHSFRSSYQTVIGDLELMRNIAVLEVDNMLRNFDTAGEKAVYEATRLLDPLEDTRDWSLLPDYGPDDRKDNLRSLTSMGPTTNQEWLNRMRLSWMLVSVMKSDPTVDPEPHLRFMEIEDDATRALFSDSEHVLLGFAARLCRWLVSVRKGTCEGPLPLLTLELGEAADELPWIAIQALQTQLEAFAMLEVITMGIRAQAKIAKENPKGYKHVVSTLSAGRRSLAAAAQRAQALAQTAITISREGMQVTNDDTFDAIVQSRAAAFSELSKALLRKSQEQQA